MHAGVWAIINAQPVFLQWGWLETVQAGPVFNDEESKEI